MTQDEFDRELRKADNEIRQALARNVELRAARDDLADALRQIEQYATMCDASGGLPSSVRLREVARAALDRHTHQDKAVT
jgi:NTP pyrophosphatase (non-canonical NTP hydrolase)